ncbi:MAG TPA: serine/threonine-protein kinase [Gemmatimonadales bacterium]|nr:serine/threonine-protein kinase [Gemmatimonadales bacterium]
MASPPDRLRESLAPRYQVSRELARGGMGVVYLGHDQQLDRPVAIKILRPELASATGAERFVREARALARLSHPNIVPVHDAGEASGVSYYVMDYVPGETLEQRLRRGPLQREEAVRLGRDVLAALTAAHQHGIVHRDIKPSNLFLHDGRVLVADFGVAHVPGTGEPLTQPEAVPGTPGYMAPEQMLGRETTPRTDLYAVGLVLYQALTGRSWDPPPDDTSADWSGVPRGLIPALKRALSWQPEQRWADATEFRRALSDASAAAPWRSAAVPAIVAGALLGVALLTWMDRPPPPPGQPQIGVERFAVAGSGPTWLGDSVGRGLCRALFGSPDFAVACDAAGAPGPLGSGAVRVGGTARVTRDSLCVEATLQSAPDRPSLGRACGPRDAWPGVAAGLARSVMREVWKRRLVRDMPVGALPRSDAGMDAFLGAEHLFAQAQWEAAYSAYLTAETMDSTCWLCSWRMHDVERWLGVPHDSLRTARYLVRVDSFPVHYQPLMRATVAPIAQRIEMERGAAQRYGTSLAWWVLGDDLFHRGPLLGFSRREALAAFERSAELRPDFAPAWEHLALVRIAEGDEAGARQALDRWTEAMGGQPHDRFSIVVHHWLQTALAWRFHPGPDAEAVAARALRVPEVAGSPLLAAGPRTLLGTFDAPEGAVWLGRHYTAWRDHGYLEPVGFLAQAMGYTALGQVDSARLHLRQLRTRFSQSEPELFAVQFEAALLLMDSSAAPEGPLAAVPLVRRYAEPGALRGLAAARAAGTLALLLDQGGSVEADRFATVATAGYGTLLQARRLARRGDYPAALERSRELDADTIAHLNDPMLRSLLRLSRGAWFGQVGNVEAARREFRWAEHSEVRGYPVGDPQTADAEWGLRTLARWRLATTMDAAGQADAEACRAYQAVARLWSRGDAAYRARADSARTRLAALRCGGPGD